VPGSFNGTPGVPKLYATPQWKLDQGKVVLAGSTSDDIASDLQFDPERAQYNALVESSGKGFMTYGKAKGPLNFLENIWRKGVSGARALQRKGMPNFRRTESIQDIERRREVGDSPGRAADVYRGALEREDRPINDLTGARVSPTRYHPTKGWYGYERDPGNR
jgi:hypothetical protein